MKYSIITTTFIFFSLNVSAQNDKISKTRFVTGLSAPELLHVGVTYRVANASQFGLNAGGGPTLGVIWPAKAWSTVYILAKIMKGRIKKPGFADRALHSFLLPSLHSNLRST